MACGADRLIAPGRGGHASSVVHCLALPTCNLYVDTRFTEQFFNATQRSSNNGNVAMPGTVINIHEALSGGEISLGAFEPRRDTHVKHNIDSYLSQFILHTSENVAKRLKYHRRT